MPANEADRPLAGRHVVVTRPAHQAEPLCRMIEQAGGAVSALPTIEIAAPDDPQQVTALLDGLQGYGLAIFVSANAVHSVCALMRDRAWPIGTRIAAVGRGSAAALERHGLRADVVPVHSFRSEGLLEEADLRDVKGLRVVIFRGETGRGLLADTLRDRGAEVDYCNVYRRRIPVGTATAVARLADAGPVDAIVVTSNGGLLNLHLAAGEERRAWLLGRQLIVIGERTAGLASALGFESPARIAGEASDDGLMEALRDWAAA